MQEIRFSSITRLLVSGFMVFTLLLGSQTVHAQKKVKLKKADQARGGKNGDEKYQRLIGNVTFVQNTTTIDCDSAHFYKKRNSVEAYGHVHIIDGDSVDITGSRLEYDGNTKKAKLRSNVVFTKLATATLYTDFLDFSRPSNLAYYFNGGRLVDSINVLTSRKGYYNLNSNLASFKTNVKVINPDYTMLADSLQYNSRSKVIYFVTETTVINKDSSTFVYKEGIYNTRSKVTDVKEGTGESKEYTIIGDRYDFDGIRNIGKVRGNVVMTSKKENLLIYGQSSDYFKASGISKVYNHAYLAKVTEDNDTLFMAADTLVSIDNDDPKKKRLLAYKNVRIFKKDMQGIADSLEYRPSDSTIYFYKKPVLWTQGNQMTADSIRMLLEHNTISKIFFVSNAFAISQDTLLNFNQIKGRKMTAELANRKINRIFVLGNGESLYYMLDEKNTALRGMNKIICSDITIRFKEGKINNLSFYKKPDGLFIPPHELKTEDKLLKGFDWKADEKPNKEDVVQTYDPAKDDISTKKKKEVENISKPKTKKAVQ
jgi:lipopolysaccharide export system protein LptA